MLKAVGCSRPYRLYPHGHYISTLENTGNILGTMKTTSHPGPNFIYFSEGSVKFVR